MTTAEPPRLQVSPEAERLRDEREACGLTRAQFSKLCGVSVCAIKGFETSRRTIDPQTFAKMRSCLDAELAKQGLRGKA